MDYLGKTGLKHIIDKLLSRINPIDKGGTGADNAEEARQNLGVTLEGLTKKQGVTIDFGTLSANGYKSVLVDPPVIDGYTPVGLSYYGTNQVAVYPVSFGIYSNGKIQGYLKNISSSALSTLYVYLTILYIKNEF